MQFLFDFQFQDHREPTVGLGSHFGLQARHLLPESFQLPGVEVVQQREGLATLRRFRSRGDVPQLGDDHLAPGLLPVREDVAIAGVAVVVAGQQDVVNPTVGAFAPVAGDLGLLERLVDVVDVVAGRQPKRYDEVPRPEHALPHEADHTKTVHKQEIALHGLSPSFLTRLPHCSVA